jgi:predicted N-acetyltransferase YhbS
MTAFGLSTHTRHDGVMTAVQIRPATVADHDRCASVFFDAFESIATRHNFPIEPQSREFTDFQTNKLLTTDGITGVVAVAGGQVVGSAFADERGPIVGIGPVTVDPAAQDAGIGRALMQSLLDRERRRQVAGVRLVQTAYHYRSLALYARLGFAVREPLSVFAGRPPYPDAPPRRVRSAVSADLDACNTLCRAVHGHDRSAELAAAIDMGVARVVHSNGRITGYASGVGYGSHAVAESNQDITELISSADSFTGLGIIVPSRNTALMQWCLASGLRLVQQSTLMTLGLYNEPPAPWLPSIVY